MRNSALVLDEDSSSFGRISEVLEGLGFEPTHVRSVAEARKQFDREPAGLVVLQLDLPDGAGIAFLNELQDLSEVEVIANSGEEELDIAVEAFRGGALDFLARPVVPKALRRIAAKVFHAINLNREVGRLRAELRKSGRFGKMIGRSEPAQHVYELIGKVAPTSSTVLIIGETGTGKELVAQTIHELSRRAHKPYAAINSGAIQPNLIESELFGHERGSFTGADRRRAGLLETTHGGTLFLDEITEMPLELQVKLLRVLESGEFRRVGGNEDLKTDLRILAATNRDPHQAVEEGVLREDLLYRLMVFPIPVPPLRERTEDIPLLAQHFLEQMNVDAGMNKHLSDAIRRELMTHPWPGNVRQLRNSVHRAWIIADEDTAVQPHPIDPNQDLRHLAPSNMSRGGEPDLESGVVAIHVGESIEQAERKLIEATLEAYDGDKNRSAKTLGVSVKTLYNRLKAYSHRSGAD